MLHSCWLGDEPRFVIIAQALGIIHVNFVNALNTCLIQIVVCAMSNEGMSS